jgi:prephenate dehydrogenase
MKPMKDILIFGMGLMGGSLSLAIRKKYPAVKVTGVVRSEKSKQEILSNNIAHFAKTEEEFLLSMNWENYDLVVFSTPVHSVIEYIPRLPLKGNTIFTDLGSTKHTIIDAVDNHFSETHHYISSHPMCGSEFSGPTAAKEDLYKEKLCILTRAKRTSEGTFNFIRDFWESMGSWTLEMESKEHDESLAFLSHLPHVISSLLVQTAIQNDTVRRLVNNSEKPITGGGFRDMTRIAGTNFEMWQSIFSENQGNVYQSLLDFRNELDSIITIFDPKRKFDREQIKSFWDSALFAKDEIQKLK